MQPFWFDFAKEVTINLYYVVVAVIGLGINCEFDNFWSVLSLGAIWSRVL